jgi:hypothetical protein
MNVYLETNLWNALCDHPVDADTLVGSLGARAITLDFSDHCVTEVAKNFQGTGLQPTVDDSSFPVLADSSMPASAAPSKRWNSFLQN